MQLTTTEAQRVLRKLDCELVECKHHIRGFVMLDGRRLFPIHCSFGRKDLPGDVPHRFRRSLWLSSEEFKGLVSCHMSKVAYFQLLRTKGLVE